MATKTNTGEGLPAGGTDVTSANSGGTSGDAVSPIKGTGVTIQSTDTVGEVIDGSKSYKLVIPSGVTGNLYWGAISGVTTVSGYQAKHRLAAAPSVAYVAHAICDSSGVMLGRVVIMNTGKFQFQDRAATTLYESTNALTFPGVYLFDLAVTVGASTTTGKVKAAVYKSDGTFAGGQTAIFENTACNCGTANINQYQTGKLDTNAVAVTTIVDSLKAIDTYTLQGTGANQAPTVTLTANQNVSAGATVTATATASDPDGSIASYAWTVVSASSTSSPTLTGAATSSVSFTAPAAGNLITLQCVVTDNAAATATATTEVRVPLAGSAAVVPLALAATKVGTWTNVGGVSSDGAALADTSDTTYLESGSVSATEQYVEFRWQPSGSRSSGQMTPIRLGTDTGTATALVKLVEGGTVRQSWTQAVNATISDYTFSLDTATIAAIGDSGNLRGRVGFTT